MARKRKPKFRSGAEEEFSKYLTTLGLVWDYETEVLPYLSDYKPDFIIKRKDNSTLYIEFKGYLKPVDRSKMIKVKKMNPTADIRIVFQRAKNKLNKNSSTTYGQWADKNGFPWADHTVPKEWLAVKPKPKQPSKRRAVI